MLPFKVTNIVRRSGRKRIPLTKYTNVSQGILTETQNLRALKKSYKTLKDCSLKRWFVFIDDSLLLNEFASVSCDQNLEVAGLTGKKRSFLQLKNTNAIHYTKPGSLFYCFRTGC